MSAQPKFADALKNEVDAADFIPYSSHVTRNIIKLDSGDYIQILRLQGAAHESADIQDINIWHDQFNNFMRNIASPHVAVWSHVVRREYGEYPDGEFAPGFCRIGNKLRGHGMDFFIGRIAPFFGGVDKAQQPKLSTGRRF